MCWVRQSSTGEAEVNNTTPQPARDPAPPHQAWDTPAEEAAQGRPSHPAMNAPPTFESFLLFDGEKKIIKEVDTKVRGTVQAPLPTCVVTVGARLNDRTVYASTAVAGFS